MKDEINCSCTGGGDAYLLQSVAIHFILKLVKMNHFRQNAKPQIFWIPFASDRFLIFSVKHPIKVGVFHIPLFLNSNYRFVQILTIKRF